jgi:hypothetical protein
MSDTETTQITNTILKSKKMSFETKDGDYKYVKAIKNIMRGELLLIEHCYSTENNYMLSSVILHSPELFNNLHPRKMAWNENFIGKTTNELSELCLEKAQKNSFGHNGLFIIGQDISNFNHSNTPNACVKYQNCRVTDTMFVSLLFAYSVCDINIDEEITIWYSCGYINEYFGENIKENYKPSFELENNYIKLDGLNTIGSAVISLSPAANALSFSSILSVAEDINNPFNEYEIYKVDGSSLTPSDLNSNRQGNVVTFSPDDNGTIYNASFYLVQKEQILVLDNSTVFNDVIYNPESGYRQERIKVAGFISSEWFGGFEVPGFIFDRADVKQWSSWIDYALGDIVSYQGYYYSAVRFLAGTDEFDSNNWMQIKKPQPALLPNWSYKAGQFEDFYNLDQDNFDTGQQVIAQHLVGYQKRQYLSNIIQELNIKINDLMPCIEALIKKRLLKIENDYLKLVDEKYHNQVIYSVPSRESICLHKQLFEKEDLIKASVVKYMKLNKTCEKNNLYKIILEKYIITEDIFTNLLKSLINSCYLELENNTVIYVS